MQIFLKKNANCTHFPSNSLAAMVVVIAHHTHRSPHLHQFDQLNDILIMQPDAPLCAPRTYRTGRIGAVDAYAIPFIRIQSNEIGSVHMRNTTLVLPMRGVLNSRHREHTLWRAIVAHRALVA